MGTPYKCNKITLERSLWNSNFEWALANRQQASNVEEPRDDADGREAQKVAPPQIWIVTQEIINHFHR